MRYGQIIGDNAVEKLLIFLGVGAISFFVYKKILDRQKNNTQEKIFLPPNNNRENAAFVAQKFKNAFTFVPTPLGDKLMPFGENTDIIREAAMMSKGIANDVISSYRKMFRRDLLEDLNFALSDTEYDEIIKIMRNG